MKFVIKLSFSLILVSYICQNSHAQSLDYETSKEKIYIHTNHVFYKPGDDLFFKLYLLNASNQLPGRKSSIAYVEILNPSGTVMHKMDYAIKDGFTEGYFAFPATTPGGIYKIRAYSNWMRNEKETTWFEKEITVQAFIAPRVLMKLDFPRKGYGPGDEVLAEYSIRNLTDQPLRNKESSVTVSIEGKEIAKQNIITDIEGKAVIKLRLPEDLNSTDGLLNVTVTEGGYTESISRSIPIVLNKIDLQFMPEGGTLVEGIPTTIAFKAVNEHGKAADIRGEIFDDQGAKITEFESYHFGMGRFHFTPQKGRTYSLRILSPINISQNFALPVASSSGVVMNVINKPTSTEIIVSATAPQRFTLIGSTKNVEYFRTEVNYRDGRYFVNVPIEDFPAGIARFTLYNEQHQPLSERIIFLNDQRILDVSIVTDKDRYKPREKVNMTLRTTDGNKSVPANLSIAIIDDKLWTMADDKQDHILSWLLMSSELRGKIEEPQFYFEKDEPKARTALDLVMLTHGYRYFDFIDEILEDGQLQFTPDPQNILSGIITNKNGKAVKATVYLIESRSNANALEITTGEDGIFTFSAVEPTVGYWILSKSLTNNEPVTITISGQIASKSITSQYKKVSLPYSKLVPFISKSESVEKTEANLPVQFNFMSSPRALSEVVVTALGQNNKRLLGYSTVSILRDELKLMPSVSAALSGRVAGVQITETFNPGAGNFIGIRGTNSISSANSPLFIVDGMVVNSISPHLLPEQIWNITVIKGAEAAAIYGSSAANGAIIIETKRSSAEKIRINLSKPTFYSSSYVILPGKQPTLARRFYAPIYESTDTDLRDDFRETIYWNPVVQTNKNGEASFSFYNSDVSTTFRAIAEGIGYNGLIGRKEITYSTQSLLSVDAKIPPYLTVGDIALIPVVITNNSNKELTARVTVSVSDTLNIGKFPVSITLKAASPAQIFIPLEAKTVFDGHIRIHVSSELETESISLPIVAAAKGFPVIETIAGNQSEKHFFNIYKMIPGTMKGKVKLYTSLEGQLLNGIESMLREPYGCFEQTSSTTYPNIFILKYLKQAGKASSDIEKKAQKYLSAGYHRLVGFETKMGGFEWFGNTPPHEALTAYGLLEFTDMQEFIKVDQAMLKRTRNFLLSRRDGNGGFLSSTGGYDRFASVPNKIANIYIVYALTQSGLRDEIQKEYETAVKVALDGDDAYQLAMMALAASNMKNNKDFSLLMEKLDENDNKKGLEAETSVVNSRGTSMKTETTALYVLALARESSPRLGKIAGLISKLLNSKSYYGYGSTQATVLALNAIVEYAKLVEVNNREGKAQFFVNDMEVALNNELSSQIKENENAFSAVYENTGNNFPYELEISYQTYTPPNSKDAELELQMQLNKQNTKVGETVRLDIKVSNKKDSLQPMAIAKIGIPAGLSFQPWQLKELVEMKKITYYEIFDNYLVFYWLGFSENESKKISLDLKAEIPGIYKGKSSTTYLYYTPEHKYWADGVDINIEP